MPSSYGSRSSSSRRGGELREFHCPRKASLCGADSNIRTSRRESAKRLTHETVDKARQHFEPCWRWGRRLTEAVRLGGRRVVPGQRITTTSRCLLDIVPRERRLSSSPLKKWPAPWQEQEGIRSTHPTVGRAGQNVVSIVDVRLAPADDL